MQKQTTSPDRARGAIVRAIAETLENRCLLASGVDRLINNNDGALGNARFTQAGTSVVAYDDRVVVGFADSGSFSDTSAHFTGFAYSSDGGDSFTDGGTLPTSTQGDAATQMMVRDTVSGRIYLSTIALDSADVVQVFHSDDDGVSWSAPVNASPNGDNEAFPRMAIDNASGIGHGNVYIATRRFDGANRGIQFYRSAAGGAFSNGVQIIHDVESPNIPAVAVGLDHAVYVFWSSLGNLFMRKSTDRGLTFGPGVTVATNLPPTDDLGLTGTPSGGSSGGFRSYVVPQVAVNPVSGNLYVVYHADGAGTDRADIFLSQSTNGGTTWSAPLRVNDDATTTDQWQPTIAITPNGHHLGIFYYSREEDTANNNLFRYWGRVARISGATLSFSASNAVSDVASPPEFGRDLQVVRDFTGDYDSAASASNVSFQVAWSDNRLPLANGNGRRDPNVYFDVVTIGNAGQWVGEGDAVSWSDPQNWGSGIVPDANDDVVIDLPGNYLVRVAGSIDVQSVTLGSGSASTPTLSIAPGSSALFELGKLSIRSGSKLDLNDNDLLLDYSGTSPIGTIQTLINSARAGGAWTGTDITSSVAKNANPRNTTLGVMEAAEYKSIYGPDALFAGEAIDSTAVLVKYTYYGDADFNGVVNFDDYSRTDAGFNQNRSGWLNGDFDGNGVVNFDDYSLIDLAFNTQGAALRPIVDAPRALWSKLDR